MPRRRSSLSPGSQHFPGLRAAPDESRHRLNDPARPNVAGDVNGAAFAPELIDDGKLPLTTGGLVLLYHRVTDGNLDPWELSVSPDRFDQQMRVLERDCTVVKLQDLLLRVASGVADRPLVAITLDDGYADNCTMPFPFSKSTATQRHYLRAPV